MTHIRGEDVDLQPLHHAALEGHVEPVRLLLEAGADKNAAETGLGFSPVHLAAHQGHLDIVHFLIECGANKDQPTTDDGHHAAQEGHLRVIHLLLESCSDIDRTTQSGATALDVALERGHREVVGFLASLEAKEPPKKIRRRRDMQ